MIAILHLRARADLYDLNDQDQQQNLKLYEERLVNKTAAGEVTIGKHVETETAMVSVPVEKSEL